MSLPDIAAVMITVDRAPKPNYLGSTILSLHHGGFFQSDIPLTLFVSSPERGEPFKGTEQAVVDLGGEVVIPDVPLLVHINWARAVRKAASQAPWVLLLEDDVAVCADFAASAKRWLAANMRDDRRLYSLFCGYPQAKRHGTGGDPYWDCVLKDYYSTCAVLLRAGDAALAADYLEGPRAQWAPRHTDWKVRDWHVEAYPDVPFMRYSAPSLVNHIGEVSSLRPVEEGFPRSPSFSGEAWAAQ